MAVRFRHIGLNPREAGLDAEALSFLAFAMSVVGREPCLLRSAEGATPLPRGLRAVARHASGQQTLIASTASAGLHAEEALLDLMRRCRWRDFKYIYVEREPCDGGAFARPMGCGCKDKLRAALPGSAGVVFYSKRAGT